MRRFRISNGAGDLLRGLGSAVVERYVSERKQPGALGAIQLVTGALEDGVGVEISKPKRRLPRRKGTP